MGVVRGWTVNLGSDSMRGTVNPTVDLTARFGFGACYFNIVTVNALVHCAVLCCAVIHRSWWRQLFFIFMLPPLY